MRSRRFTERQIVAVLTEGEGGGWIEELCRRPGKTELRDRLRELAAERRCWGYRRGVKITIVRPGKPVENGIGESINGSFRDEGPNEHGFTSLAEPRHTIERWRRNNLGARPHSSLVNLTPKEFVEQAGSATGQWAAVA